MSTQGTALQHLSNQIVLHDGRGWKPESRTGMIKEVASLTLPMNRGHNLKLDPHADSCSLEELSSRYRDTRAPLAIDLFSGAGGLSLGLKQAGFEVILGVDRDQKSAATHKAWFGGASLCEDLSDPAVLARIEEAVEGLPIALIAGGPPCQPFSKAGRNKIRSLVRDGSRPQEDGRRELWRSFIDVVRRVKPRAVLIENVPDLAGGEASVIFSSLIEELEWLGFDVYSELLSAWHYGVPQHRRRLIIVGVQPGMAFSWPEIHADERTTVELAIGDLPPIQAGSQDPSTPYGGPNSHYQHQMRRGMNTADHSIDDHIARLVREDDLAAYRSMDHKTKYTDLPTHLLRYRKDIFKDRYNRLDWNDLSRTITAHLSRDGYWYIHPEQHRTLTVREAARLQSFPDWFRFSSTPSHAFRQIGEAVPPLLGEAVGRSILEGFSSSALKDEPIKTRDLGLVLRNWLRPLSDEDLLGPWRRSGTLWLTLLGMLLFERSPSRAIRNFWPLVRKRWENPQQYLADDGREGSLKALKRERVKSILDELAEQLTEQQPHVRIRGLAPDRLELAKTLAGSGRQLSPFVGGTRVAERVLGRASSGSDAISQMLLARLIGTENRGEAYAAVLEVADQCCLPEKPRCELCPLACRCSFHQERVLTNPQLREPVQVDCLEDGALQRSGLTETSLA